MSLALSKPKQVALHANTNTTSKDAPQVENNYQYCMENHGGPTPNKKPQ